jgi:acetylornithine deacetylase/succinyl-diaminopimelate desuccinylase-like protein
MSFSSNRVEPALYERPVELLQRLIRFDTTNPPGNEAACIAFINDLLMQAGLSTIILAADPARPNLITRLKGRGDAPPLLLQGHIDVVTTEKQDWQHPPFSGDIADGYIWGRGTLDMKGTVTMMICALLRAHAEGVSLPGDVILAILSDEEAGGPLGAQYLVENHPQIFEGVRYALGELGGFTSYIAGHKFYPIQVLEKQMCWLRATIHGPGGHGSMPMRGGAMAKLGRMLQRLDQHRLPVHITPIPQQMIETITSVLPETVGAQFQKLLDPTQTDSILDQLATHAAFFDPILHNTINATTVHGGAKVNVIPSEIVLELDGRLLPGFTADDMLQELHALLGNDIEFEVVLYGKGRAEADMGLYETLADILREADPGGTPMPVLMPAVTDGRFFSQLGIQTYGFHPMNLPEDLNFLQSLHAANERLPIEALNFGTQAIYQVLLRNKA